MTQEEKQLLIKDLCARVPHRTFVCLNPGAYKKPETCILTGVHGEKVHLNVDSDPFRIDHIKPYLRPMSSMTEEEENEWSGFNIDPLLEAVGKPHTRIEDLMLRAKSQYNPLDWLNEHHFDYRGLIPMGLALEAPEDMYGEN